MLNSKHFSYQEFACHTGEPYPPEWVDSRLQKLCGVLDEIRDAWGGPIIVVCGYRTPDYNAYLRSRSSGVAANSQHPLGTAADVACVPRTQTDVARLYRMVENRLAAGYLFDLGGLGVYPGWIHVDVRDRGVGGHVARWVGRGFGAEPVA